MVNEANPNAYNNPRVRTWGPPGGTGRRVVATVQPPAPTGSYAGPSSNQNVQQNIRQAEANPAPYVSGADLAKQQEEQAQLIANTVLGTEMSSGGQKYTTPYQQALATIYSDGNGGGGSGGMKASDKLALDKWNAEKAQNQAVAEKNQRTLQGMIDQLTSKSYRGNIDDLISQIEGMNTTGKQNINDVYNTAIGNIGAGYTTAQDLMNTGYGALQDYLSQNQNNPYAGLGVTMPTVSNPMENYLNAYGAMSPDIANQIQAEQIAGQQGAGAFQNLINVLGANAKSNDLSRLAEAKMAQTMGLTGLGTQKAAYTSQAANAQQQALASLAQQIAQSKFEQEQAAGNRYQSILDSIIGAGGSLPTAPPPPPPTGKNTSLSQDVLDQLAARTR
jgi:hypothetical protein